MRFFCRSFIAEPLALGFRGPLVCLTAEASWGGFRLLKGLRAAFLTPAKGPRYKRQGHAPPLGTPPLGCMHADRHDEIATDVSESNSPAQKRLRRKSSCGFLFCFNSTVQDFAKSAEHGLMLCSACDQLSNMIN